MFEFSYMRYGLIVHIDMNDDSYRINRWRHIGGISKVFSLLRDNKILEQFKPKELKLIDNKQFRYSNFAFIFFQLKLPVHYLFTRLISNRSLG